MITSSLDILYLAIGISSVLIAIFLCVVLLYLALILRDVNKTTEYVKDTTEKVNEFILKPLTLAGTLVDKMGPVLDIIQERGKEALKNVKKRK